MNRGARHRRHPWPEFPSLEGRGQGERLAPYAGSAPGPQMVIAP